MSLKRISIIVSVVVFATLTWWSAKVWLAGSAPFTDWQAMLAPAIALMLLGAVSGLASMVLDARLDRTLIILGSWVSFMPIWSFNRYYLALLPVFILLWWQGNRIIRTDLADRHAIRVSATLSSGMNYILFGIFLMVSLGFYLTPYAQEANELTVSKGIQGSLDSAYKNDLVQMQLNQLPSGARAQVQRDIIKTVDSTVREKLKPIAQWIPPVLALGLFLALWSATAFFRWGAILVAMGVFAVLKATGFVKIVEKDVRAEVMTL